MDRAEREVRKRSRTAAIEVGLTRDYMPAFQMYIRRGYLPWPLGVLYQGREKKHGDKVKVDDALTILLKRTLR